ncbi:MAG: BMP family ABC transporter substrate-binding protein [Candidatus Thorarchaeota archaeon]|nr:BMP family ABC transporter substrate-binding protein [Candidatus Thorarchaeota archaeon]
MEVPLAQKESTSIRTIAAAVIIVLLMGVTLGFFLFSGSTNGNGNTTTTTPTTTTTMTSPTTTTPTEPMQDGEIAIVFTTSGLGDKSFNDAAFRGAQQFENDFGWDFDYVEPESISEYETHLRDYADPEGREPYELIISIGFDQAESLNETAEDYPNQKFCIIDTVVDQPNVSSAVFDEHEGSALVGAIAGMWTEREQIGFIGGMDIPLVNRYAAGYVWGANYSNPGIDFTVSYTGSWTDTTAGQNLADGMYANGVDTIYTAAGRAGLGAFTAAKNNNTDHNVWVIGSDSPQMYLGTENPENPEPPTVCVTSMLKKIDVAVYENIKNVYNNQFQGGVQVFDLANGGLGYETNQDLLSLPADIITAVENLKQKIIDGELTVPSSKYW